MIKIERTDTYGWEPQYPGGGCFGCELNSDHNCRVDKFIVGKTTLT